MWHIHERSRFESIEKEEKDLVIILLMTGNGGVFRVNLPRIYVAFEFNSSRFKLQIGVIDKPLQTSVRVK